MHKNMGVFLCKTMKRQYVTKKLLQIICKICKMNAKGLHELRAELHELIFKEEKKNESK